MSCRVGSGSAEPLSVNCRLKKVNQRGLTFVPVIFTTSGGMGEAFQRQIWHPHWKRVKAEDAEMKLSKWVSRKRKLTWMA